MAKKNNLWELIGALALPFGAAAIGGSVTVSNIPTWYAGLAKPGFTPPNWVFGPVWTLLYILMGVAFYRVIRNGCNDQPAKVATVFFVLQLILNAAWSVVFFGQHDLYGGVVVIALLLLALIGTIITFYRIDRLAAWLLLPYLIWSLYATALTIGVYTLN